MALNNNDSICGSGGFLHSTSNGNDGEMKSLLEERKKLESIVGELQDEKESLSSDVTSLSSQKETLQREISKLRLELDDINSELQSQRKTATKEADLKNKIQEYLELIEKLLESSSFGKGDKVEWKVIGKNHPIYSLDSATISEYIKSQKQKYAQEMSITLEEAEAEFANHSPALEELEKLVMAFPYYLSRDYESINAIISAEDLEYWDETEAVKVKSIITILQDLKMPVYNKTFSSVDDEKDDTPSNVDALIRELYFEKIALVAISKQKIAESELKAVVKLLKKFIPEGTDLKSLVSKYLNQDEFLSQISSSAGSVDDAIGTTGFTK